MGIMDIGGFGVKIRIAVHPEHISTEFSSQLKPLDSHLHPDILPRPKKLKC
jgi:hypothetical protein